jgi:hypothetical protein
MAEPAPMQVIKLAPTANQEAARLQSFLGSISRIKEKRFKFKSFKQHRHSYRVDFR